MRATAARVAVILLGTGCVQVRSSAVATGRPLAPSAAAVEVSATRDPPGAEERATIEVQGSISAATLESLVAEFRSRVASAGGNYGRIDSFATRHELVTESYQYECGTPETQVRTQTASYMGPEGSTVCITQYVPVTKYVSRTCTGERRVEVATRTLIGRALRTSRGDR